MEAQPASAGALLPLPGMPGTLPLEIAIVLCPAPRPSGLDDVGLGGTSAAGCVRLVTGLTGLSARGLLVAGGHNAAAVVGVRANRRAGPWRHNPHRDDTFDGLVKGLGHKGRATAGAGARS